uniref:Protocadherin 2 alpha a 15 n=1 Tax=Gouania willdenowi TaxID=441366 RepID=A0A8C5DPQ5_GOUWI
MCITWCQCRNKYGLCVAFAVALVMFLRTASAQIRYSISEEVKEGTVVGNIARDLGVDVGAPLFY